MCIGCPALCALCAFGVGEGEGAGGGPHATRWIARVCRGAPRSHRCQVSQLAGGRAPAATVGEPEATFGRMGPPPAASCPVEMSIWIVRLSASIYERCLQRGREARQRDARPHASRSHRKRARPQSCLPNAPARRVVLRPKPPVKSVKRKAYKSTTPFHARGNILIHIAINKPLTQKELLWPRRSAKR